MSITAEQVAEREFEMSMGTDVVCVRVPVSWYGTLCLPDSDGEDEEWAAFKVWTFGDNLVAERLCAYDVDMDGKGQDRTEVDYSKMRRVMLRRALLDWSLDIPIERNADWLTKECYSRVGKVYAPLMEALVSEYEKSISIADKEEEKISRQSSILFSPNSRGVNDACEAISIFCTYGNFAEKFEIDRNKLFDLPYREFMLLRMMMNKEGEATKRANKTQKNHHAGTRIAAGSTKPRASRGKSIAM